ncbi:MAG: CPBP family intramembrane metalloprotease [Clostridia bacterium]|nr:CPBP family intramembrane metalloprotease [Clostridia bacterium]
MAKFRSWYENLDENMQNANLFLILTFGIGWLIMLIAFIFGVRNPQTGSLLFYVLMFVPLAANLVTRLVTGEGFEKIRIKPKLRHNFFRLIISYFMPILLMLGGTVLYFFLNEDKVSLKPDIIIGGLMEINGIEEDQALGVFYGQQVMGYMISPFIYILATICSESGWRGLLLQKLSNRIGIMKASLVTGIAQGVWFVPLVLMGYNYGSYGFVYTLAGTGLNLLFYISAGVITSYYVLRTDSVLPCAFIMSGMLYCSSLGVYFANSNLSETEMLFIGPAGTGIVGMSLVIFAALTFFLKLRRMEWDEFDERISNVRGERQPGQKLFSRNRE